MKIAKNFSKAFQKLFKNYGETSIHCKPEYLQRVVVELTDLGTFCATGLHALTGNFRNYAYYV